MRPACDAKSRIASSNCSQTWVAEPCNGINVNARKSFVAWLHPYLSAWPAVVDEKSNEHRPEHSLYAHSEYSEAITLNLLLLPTRWWRNKVVPLHRRDCVEAMAHMIQNAHESNADRSLGCLLTSPASDVPPPQDCSTHKSVCSLCVPSLASICRSPILFPASLVEAAAEPLFWTWDPTHSPCWATQSSRESSSKVTSGCLS